MFFSLLNVSLPNLHKHTYREPEYLKKAKLTQAELKYHLFQSTHTSLMLGNELLLAAIHCSLDSPPETEKSVFPPLDTSVIDIAHFEQDTVVWQDLQTQELKMLRCEIKKCPSNAKMLSLGLH